MPWRVGTALAVGSWDDTVVFLPDALAGLPALGRRIDIVPGCLPRASATVVAALLLQGAAAPWRARQQETRLPGTRDGVAQTRSLSRREFKELVVEAPVAMLPAEDMSARSPWPSPWPWGVGRARSAPICRWRNAHLPIIGEA